MVTGTVKELRKKGYRITPARKALVEIFLDTEKPLNAKELFTRLEKSDVKVDKSTVYREIDFLIKEGIIKQVYIKPGISHYEPTHLPHHHHIVCEACGKIDKVENKSVENSISKLVEKTKKKGFIIKEHKLEFYGKCLTCK